jgi:hypothetical protein
MSTQDINDTQGKGNFPPVSGGGSSNSSSSSQSGHEHDLPAE